jgi:hypothetical protein
MKSYIFATQCTLQFVLHCTNVATPTFMYMYMVSLGPYLVLRTVPAQHGGKNATHFLLLT